MSQGILNVIVDMVLNLITHQGGGWGGSYFKPIGEGDGVVVNLINQREGGGGGS